MLSPALTGTDVAMCLSLSLGWEVFTPLNTKQEVTGADNSVVDALMNNTALEAAGQAEDLLS